MFVSVIIPAQNEEQSLPKVIRDIPKNSVRDIIVVDNDSRDNTAKVAQESGCRVVFEAQHGYGRACLTGISSLSSETDVVVFLDADHSDHADQMGRLLGPILNGDADFVIGSRALGNREAGAMTPQAFWGNKLACFLMRVFWGQQYTDLGPFRAISFSALKKLGMTDEDFGWTIEMQIRAVEEGLNIHEVPVDYRRRIGRSKISGTFKGAILAGKKILQTIFKYKFFRKKALAV